MATIMAATTGIIVEAVCLPMVPQRPARHNMNLRTWNADRGRARAEPIDFVRR